MSLLMGRTLSVLLAGGAGERLHPLTRHRAKPAVPFGGNYRIIDVTLSNCINSGLRKILVLTQYKALSLNQHVRHGWHNLFPHDLGEFIETVPPQKRVGENWYIGTADAVWQNLYSINSVEQVRFVLILAGDHIYKMDYYKIMRQHVESQADVTVAVTEMPRDQASRLGVIEIRSDGQVVGFEEKPADPKPLPSDPERACVSMGIYVFNKEFLTEALEEDAKNSQSTHDFGRDLLPSLVEKHKVQVHHFIDENKKELKYWLDIGTIDAYYAANMDLVNVTPQFNLYDQSWPLRTHQPQHPPAKFVFDEAERRMGVAVDSLVSAGCIISGGHVTRSLLSPGVRVHSYSDIRESLLFADVDIGRHARIKNAILDRGVRVPEGCVIGYDEENDKSRFHVTEMGTVVVSAEDL